MRDEDTPEPEGSRRGAAEEDALAPAGAPALALRALAVARDARENVAAVEQLRAALWERMLAALAEPSAGEVAELADRLARLCSALLSASLPTPTRSHAEPEEERRQYGPEQERGRAERATPAPATRRGGAGAAAGTASTAAGLIVDERGAYGPPAAPTMPVAAGQSFTAPGPEIAVRDERARRAGAPPWIAAISRQLALFERDHRPFAVMLLELRELERLRAALSPPELDRLSAEVARAIAELTGDRAPAQGPDRAALAEEPITQAPGRFWLIAPATDAGAARALAEGIAAALADRAGGLLVGIAVCPLNARTAVALAAHADVDLYAARAPLPVRT